MHKNLKYLTAGLYMMCGTALAQNSITLYGLIDTGIAYVSNQAGEATAIQQTGAMQGSRIGIRGTEEISSDLKAIFKIENRFDSSDGIIMTGGRLFGGEAWTGINSKNAGALTVGRQYDLMYELGYFMAAQYTSSYAFRPPVAGVLNGANGSAPDIDHLAGTRIDNSIKYEAPAIGGLALSGLYGLNEASATNTGGHVWSASARYTRGPLMAGAAFSTRQNALAGADYRTWGAGISYKLQGTTLQALYTSSELTTSDDRVDVLEVSAKHQIAAPLYVAAGYAYIRPNHESANAILQGRRHQASLALDYSLSRRTTVYSVLAHHRAQEGNIAQLFGLAPSDDNRQTVAQVGIRHRF